jgi:basic membrane lipoprotein Med (substrate-binding protein (PBP1-ABC) superfamily)
VVLVSLQGISTKAVCVACALLLLVTLSAAKTTRSSTRKKAHPTVSSHSKSVKSHSARSKETSTATKGKKGKRRKSASRHHGQQAIESERTREIQQALIREHYLDGEPTGVLDDRTKQALTKFQNDNGWQTKIVPDSRALIKLGLGPSHEGLLNPDSAALAGHELGVERDIPGGAVPHK